MRRIRNNNLPGLNTKSRDASGKLYPKMRKRVAFCFTPFSQLSRGRQRDLYVSLRWKIARHASLYGGKFTSGLVLNEPGRPKLYNQWFSLYFLGNDRYTFWKTTISTAAVKFWEETQSIALDRALSLLTEEQREEECGLKFEGPFFRDGEKYYTMAERKPQRFDCFGGLTMREYTEKTELEIIENEPPSIYESFEVDLSYQYGIGLNAIVQADEINREVIEATIERFRQVGENNWQSPQPVSRELLPFETQKMALSKVEYPSVLLGIKERG